MVVARVAVAREVAKVAVAREVAKVAVVAEMARVVVRVGGAMGAKATWEELVVGWARQWPV